jgi:hypothetical protein
MKKQLINEAFRLQALAGLKPLYEANDKVTPEQAAQQAVKVANKLENNSEIDSIASDIAKDPKATKQLMDLLNKYGVNPANVSENIDNNAFEKIALAMAKKADSSDNLSEEAGFDYGGAFWLGFVGGGALGRYIASIGDVITPYMQLHGYSPSHFGAMVAGSLLGVALLTIGKMVYDKVKNDNSISENESKSDELLRKAVAEKDINKAKNIIANYIKSSQISDKGKKEILTKVKSYTDKEKLDYYIANSLLKFEKMGLNEGPFSDWNPTYEDDQTKRLFLGKIMPALKILNSSELKDKFKSFSPRLQDYILQDIQPQELLRLLPSDYHITGDLNEGENNYVMVTYEGNNIQNKVLGKVGQLDIEKYIDNYVNQKKAEYLQDDNDSEYAEQFFYYEKDDIYGKGEIYHGQVGEDTVFDVFEIPSNVSDIDAWVDSQTR